MAHTNRPRANGKKRETQNNDHDIPYDSRDLAPDFTGSSRAEQEKWMKKTFESEHRDDE